MSVGEFSQDPAVRIRQLRVMVRYHATRSLAQLFDLQARRAGDRQHCYFMQMGDGPIKIGISAWPKTRQRELQTGAPYQLTLLGSIKGGRCAERYLHQAFSHLHLRGEWFTPNELLLAFIDGLLAGAQELRA